VALLREARSRQVDRAGARPDILLACVIDATECIPALVLDRPSNLRRTGPPLVPSIDASLASHALPWPQSKGFRYRP
jgi:hypothetical protein